jgi:O-succinylhomoserine sulfhydrylase
MPTNKKPGKWRRRTQAVRGGQMRTPFQETCEPLIFTAGFAYEAAEEAEARFKGESPGFQYSRLANPTVAMFEERMAALEGAPLARATATGMAAVSAVFLGSLQAGDHVVSANAVFGSCRYVIESVLPRFGIACTFVDGTDLNAWKAAMRKETKLLFVETPSNPTLSIVDIAGVAKIAHDGGARMIVDNAFATPALQRPFEMGADIVVHSTTKFIDGQGRALGGAILCHPDFLEDNLQQFLRNTGPSISPFNAWLHLKSLETLELRMKAHCDGAGRIADFLAGNSKVARVIYPFRADHPQAALARKQMSAGGGVVTFEIKGGKTEAFRFANALEIIDVSNNLGDTKSLITHPETTTHQKMTQDARDAAGVTSGMVRLSVGLEDVEDLCEDLENALKAI